VRAEEVGEGGAASGPCGDAEGAEIDYLCILDTTCGQQLQDHFNCATPFDTGPAAPGQIPGQLGAEPPAIARVRQPPTRR
jgi:hypothetical protein